MHRTTFSPKCCWSISSVPNLGIIPSICFFDTYRNLEHELVALVVGGEGIENRGKLLAVELD
jgi:hypothetical protein